MMQIQFPDRMVTYDTFMSDLASRIAEKLTAIKGQPEVVSQRKAFSLFGRANVERWLRQGKLHPSRRVGKVEYLTSELRTAQSNTQDYFK